MAEILDNEKTQSWLWDLGVAYERALEARGERQRQASDEFLACMQPAHPGPSSDPAEYFVAWVGRATGARREGLLRALPVAIAAAARNRQHNALELFVRSARQLAITPTRRLELSEYVHAMLADQTEARRSSPGLPTVIGWLVEGLTLATLRVRLADWKQLPGWTPRLSWTVLEASKENPKAVQMVVVEHANLLARHLSSLSAKYRKGFLENVFSEVSFQSFCDALATLNPSANKELFARAFDPACGLTIRPGGGDVEVGKLEIGFLAQRAVVRPRRLTGTHDVSWELEISYALLAFQLPASEEAGSAVDHRRGAIRQVRETYSKFSKAGANSAEKPRLLVLNAFSGIAEEFQNLLFPLQTPRFAGR